MNEKLIREAMYCFSNGASPSNDYKRGMVFGLLAALIAHHGDHVALTVIASNWQKDWSMDFLSDDMRGLLTYKMLLVNRFC
jgi:hypothetical protein